MLGNINTPLQWNIGWVVTGNLMKSIDKMKPALVTVLLGLYTLSFRWSLIGININIEQQI